MCEHACSTAAVLIKELIVKVVESFFDANTKIQKRTINFPVIHTLTEEHQMFYEGGI
jgi:flagellar biosynthesis protein FliQ